MLVLATVAVLAPSREAAADPVHTVRFLNRCNQQVWLAAFGSADVTPDNSWALAPTCTQNDAATVCPSGVCDAGSCTCETASDCEFGSTAQTTASCDLSSHHCIKATTVEVDAGWSGRFWPRTGCSGTDAAFVCETGQCGAPNGNIDCTVQQESANVATLFELASADVNGADNFDVSLVSGYNVPVTVKVQLPVNTQRWTASTSFAAGYQIIENVNGENFSFTNGGAAGTSSGTRPVFPDVWTGTVPDGSDIVWVNTGPVCETSGCRRRGIREEKCPSALRVMSTGGKYIGCDAPANACAPVDAACHAHLDYYQCQNNGGAQDLFSKTLTLQTANAATFVCFGADDCPHGTTCQLDPEFADTYKMPKGSGLCTPVAQNGGCTPSDNGQACPAIDYPFVDYECHTLANVVDNAQVCVPPKTRGMGDLWWNAANWTHDAPPTPTPTGSPGPTPTPGPTPSPVACTGDGECASGQKCLTADIHGGLEQCPPGTGCTCWYPKTCTAATCPGANQCLNVDGVPDGKSDGGNVVDCTTETCYCGPQGIYSGTCGATNPKWLQAARKISEPGAEWPRGFKQSCPVAYSFQFDDPSSNWSCTNYGGLNDYRVVFCGEAGD